MQTKQPCVCGRAYWPAQAWQHEGCKAKYGAATVVTNISIADIEWLHIANKGPKYKNPEKRRIYMRDLMRKRRAKARG